VLDGLNNYSTVHESILSDILNVNLIIMMMIMFYITIT